MSYWSFESEGREAMRRLKQNSIYAVFVIWSAALLCIAGCATGPKLIPRTVLFGNPVKSRPNISPDGKMMAYLAPVNDVLNVWVKTIGKADDRAVTEDKIRGIRRYFWAEDSKHIMYLQDVGGDCTALISIRMK